MKGQEVWEAWKKDSSLKFKSEVNGRIVGLLHGIPLWEDSNKEISAYSFMENTWQLTRQPVPWQEAIQAWAEGNNLKICFADNVYTVRGGEPMRIDKNDLTNGTWYVED